MKGCARFLAIVSLLLFIISAALALIMVNIRYYLLAPDTYSLALNEAGVFEQLPEIAADQLRHSMTFNPCQEDPTLCEDEGPAPESTGGPPAYFADLPEGVWEKVLSELVDSTWLEAQTESVLEQVFSILMGYDRREGIEISLVEVKDRIAGDAGYLAVIEVIQAQPECTPEQIFDLNQSVISEGMSDAGLQCRPPEELMTLVEPFIRSGLSKVVVGLPSKLEIEIPAELLTAGSGAASMLSITQAGFRYAPWLAVFWLLALTVFAVRDLRSWLGWWGSGLFMAALPVVGFGVGLYPLLAWSLDRFVIPPGPSGFSPAMMDLGFTVVDQIVAGFSSRVLAQAGVMLGVGLLMLILRLFTKAQTKGQIGAPLTEPRPSV